MGSGDALNVLRSCGRYRVCRLSGGRAEVRKGPAETWNESSTKLDSCESPNYSQRRSFGDFATSVTLPLGKVKRSEEHTSELQSLMRISYAVFCLKKKTTKTETSYNRTQTRKHILYIYTNNTLY